MDVRSRLRASITCHSLISFDSVARASASDSLTIASSWRTVMRYAEPEPGAASALRSLQ